MFRELLTSVILVCAFGPAYCKEVKNIPLAECAKEPTLVWRQESTNGAFDLGENLKFVISWKFITVGYASMSVESDGVGGRKAYHIATASRSTPFFDNFYRVRDTNESWIDMDSLCTLKYASVNDENNKKNNETIVFDQLNHNFRIIESSKTGCIPLWVQDVLSSLYYVRTQNLEVGKDISVDAHSGDLSWPLRVKVLRKEKVSVPAGDYDCFVVEPELREDAGIFQQKGKLTIWMTADAKKVPVMMRSKIVVGSVSAELTEMKLK